MQQVDRRQPEREVLLSQRYVSLVICQHPCPTGIVADYGTTRCHSRNLDSWTHGSGDGSKRLSDPYVMSLPDDHEACRGGGIWSINRRNSADRFLERNDQTGHLKRLIFMSFETATLSRAVNKGLLDFTRTQTRTPHHRRITTDPRTAHSGRCFKTRSLSARSS